MKAKPDQLADLITEELLAYSQETTDGIKEAVLEVSEDTVREIRKKSPIRSGKYRRGWRAKVAYESDDDIRVVIHNRAKPQIVHLLEDGHAKQTGGRVEGHPHVGPAALKAAKALERKAKVVAAKDDA